MQRTLTIGAPQGGSMARRSKRKRMQLLSVVLFLTVVGLVIVGVAKLRQDNLLTGWELIGWAFVPLAILLGFTVHTTCGVTTTRRTPCKNDAYGFLFGCTGYGHWLEKFLVRLGFQKESPQQVQRRQPEGAQAFTYQPATQSQPIRVTVQDSARTICGFWFGLISVVVAVAQTIIAVAIH